MPIDEERVGKLRRFGLSDYGARAYLALLDLGTTDARQASRLAKVPVSKIYHVLDQLQERGLVRVLPESPKRYEPVPFEEHLDRVREEHARSIEAIERERDELAALFRVQGDTKLGDHGGLTLVRGRRNALDKTGELLRATRGDALVLASAGFVARLRRHRADLEDLRARGARLRVLLPPGVAAAPEADELRSLAEVRERAPDADARGASVQMAVADGRLALVVDHVPDDASLLTGKDAGALLTHEGLVAGVASVLEALWAAAPPLEGAPARERGLDAVASAPAS